MNILLINNQVRPEVSGIASHFENISKNMTFLGHNVIRIAADDPAFKNKEGGVNYYFFTYNEKISGQTPSKNKKRIENNYTNIENVLKQINWKDINLVIASNDIYLSLLKKYIAPKKILAIIPSFLAFSKFSNPDGYIKIVKRIKKNARNVRIIVLSNRMKRMLSVLLGKNYKINVIPPGVHHARFSKKTTSKKSSLLYVGRISKEKNIEALFTVMKKINTPCSLTIVGSGGDLKKNITKTKKLNLDKKIIFVGRQEHVEDYYAQAKIFILPSTCEAFGLVILEAMAAGLPVIAFRPSKKILTASDEIISDAVNGFLVKDEDEMTEKIELLLKDKKLLEKMGKKALEKTRQFDWQNHVKEILSFSEHN